MYSVPSDCLSQHLSLSTCCIQFAWLGIRFFYGGYTYQYPPWVTDPLHTPLLTPVKALKGKDDAVININCSLMCTRVVNRAAEAGDGTSAGSGRQSARQSETSSV